MKITLHDLGFGPINVHETAVVDTPNVLHEGVQIWHFAHIMKNAKIGAGTTIGQGVHVASGVQIGERCRIQNGAQLFTGVEIGDDVFIGPCVVFTNVLTPRAFVSRRDDYKKTVIGRGASIGANATIRCGITIGEYAMVGAGAVVTKSISAHSLVYGNPAEHQGWVCKCGVVLGKLPFRDSQKVCTECGTEWRRSGDDTIKRVAP